MLNNDHHITMLSMYAKNGNLREMEEMVQFYGLGADIFNTKRGFLKKTIMHDAAEGGHVEIMAYLKARCADICIKDDMGNEPIHLAARYGNLEAVKWLVGQGADINAKDKLDCTPMYYAIREGQLEIAKWLKGKGINIEKDGGTLIHTAAEFGKVKIMEWLKQEGLDINAKNNKGKTPFDMAVTPLEYGNELYSKDKEEAVKWLKQQIASSVAKVEVGNRQNTGTVIQSMSYKDYLKELGHTVENVVTEEIVPLENEIKLLQEDIKKQKRENHELSVDIENQELENEALR